MRIGILCLLALGLLATNAYASMNITYVNTTVFLNQSSTAKVVETFLVKMTNSTVPTYLSDRQAINLTIGEWRQALSTDLLIQHVFNPNSSIKDFTFLPGPIISNNGQTAYAIITMSYIAYNITTVQNIGPRKFDYLFDSSALNFEHTASGEALPTDLRFNIVIPKGSEVSDLFPEPDYPYPNSEGTYNNDTLISWDEGEPLSGFTFSYIVTQSLQDEVTAYFVNMYNGYTQQIYLVTIILAGMLAVYIYAKVFA